MPYICTMQELPSKLLQQAVDSMASLPGIGRKTALRLVLHLLKREPSDVRVFSDSFTKLREEIAFCHTCHNLSDNQICSICNDRSRNRQQVCVVEDVRDVMAIENTGQYRGLYHVLGGLISPIEGTGPGDLTIDALIQRVAAEDVQEVILALSATMEGDTTNFYLYRKLGGQSLQISTLSRGVSVGDELEYTDEITLGRSILNRTPFETSLNR
jgi:recombination protein RecR